MNNLSNKLILQFEVDEKYVDIVKQRVEDLNDRIQDIYPMAISADGCCYYDTVDSYTPSSGQIQLKLKWVSYKSIAYVSKILSIIAEFNTIPNGLIGANPYPRHTLEIVDRSMRIKRDIDIVLYGVDDGSAELILYLIRDKFTGELAGRNYEKVDGSKVKTSLKGMTLMEAICLLLHFDNDFMDNEITISISDANLDKDLDTDLETSLLIVKSIPGDY